MLAAPTLGSRANDWIKNISRVNVKTGNNWRYDLYDFERFCSKEYCASSDKVIALLLKNKVDVYKMLSDFAYWLTVNKLDKEKIASTKLNYRVKNIRYFLSAIVFIASRN